MRRRSNKRHSHQPQYIIYTTRRLLLSERLLRFAFSLRCRLLRTLDGHLLQALGIESVKIEPEKFKQHHWVNTSTIYMITS